MSLLEVDQINTYYDESHVLFDVSLHIEEGEVVALLGRNGSGKTTTMLTIMGILTPRAGTVTFDGKTISGKQPYEIAQLGVQLVPDTRRIIKTITVEENLQLAAFTAKSPWTLKKIYETFPRLEQRKTYMGRSLSGGEQQMLAIARALIRDARVLLLDEPFEGLAPIIVRDLLETTKLLAAEGRTILIVEQNVRAALVLAHRTYLLDRGHVVLEATPAELESKPDVMHQYLGV
ncbi:MAG: ABC transporter ATP-binding protein [Vulcanimicrobiaceae bacterium]|jgi:branched-chain amino acid transport system ATP-binding protein